jgi:hypothetical protein
MDMRYRGYGRETYQCSLGTAMIGAFSVVFPVSLFSNSPSSTSSSELATLPRTKASKTREQKSARILEVNQANQGGMMDIVKIHIMKSTRLSWSDNG